MGDEGKGLAFASLLAGERVFSAAVGVSTRMARLTSRAQKVNYPNLPLCGVFDESFGLFVFCLQISFVRWND